MQLELNARTWKLDQPEQGAVERFLTEMRRTYWKHEKWCKPAEHKQAAEGAELDETPCVGRLIQTADKGTGGWRHQAGVGAEPRFYLDRNRRIGPNWDASPDDLRVVLSFLPEDAPLRPVFTQALADLEQGMPAEVTA